MRNPFRKKPAAPNVPLAFIHVKQLAIGNEAWFAGKFCTITGRRYVAGRNVPIRFLEQGYTSGYILETDQGTLFVNSSGLVQVPAL